MAAPLVTVVVPVYNGARWLPATLRSALAQTHTALDVIVVDDGSTDDSLAVAEGFATGDDRVRVLRQANGGVAAARNLALAHARGAFLAPLDADDLWAPTKIERQLARFAAGSGHLGLVYTWWAALDEASHVIGKADRIALEGYVYPALVCVNFVGNSSVPLFRREAVEAVGGFVSYRERGGQGCEDWDLALRVAERYAVGVAPAYLTGYRSVEGSMSRSLEPMRRSFDFVMDDALARHPEIPPDLVRWTRSRLYSYLANLAYADGRVGESTRLSARAIGHDPLAILSLPILRVLGVGFARWVAGPVIRQRWPDQSAWRRFRGRSAPDARPVPLDAFEDALHEGDPSWSWEGDRVYDRVCRRRWARARDLCATPPPAWTAGADRPFVLAGAAPVA